MKSLLLTFLICYCLKTTNAQDSTRIVNKYVETETGIGYLHADFSSLNAYLNTNGMNSLSHDRLLWNSSILWTRRTRNPRKFGDRSMHGVSLDVIIPTSEEQPNSRKTRFVGYNLAYQFGYAFLQKGSVRMSIYFKYSLFNTYSVQVIDNGFVANVNDVVNQQHGNATLEMTRLLFGTTEAGLVLNKDFRLKSSDWDCPQNERFIMLSLKIAYTSTHTQPMTYNGQALSEAPSLDLQGLFVKLGIGSGRRIRQVKWQ